MAPRKASPHPLGVGPFTDEEEVRSVAWAFARFVERGEDDAAADELASQVFDLVSVEEALPLLVVVCRYLLAEFPRCERAKKAAEIVGVHFDVSAFGAARPER